MNDICFIWSFSHEILAKEGASRVATPQNYKSMQLLPRSKAAKLWKIQINATGVTIPKSE